MPREEANIASDTFSESVERRLKRLRLAAKVCSVIGSFILGLLVAVGVVVLVLPRLLGLQPYAIVSGSMEPSLPVGTVVYAETTDGEQLCEGDIAAFWRNDEVIVHRILSVDENSGALITKGDANSDPDMHPVPYQNVLGRVVFSMPVAGTMLMMLGSTTGKLILGWVVLLAAALCIAGTMLRSMASRNTALS